MYDKNKISKSSKFYVHRLVAETFLENYLNMKAVDHINNNKKDNRAVNLRYATHSQNSNYYVNNFKEEVYKPILQYDLNGKLIKEWNNIIEICNHYKYHSSNIYRVANGEYRSSYGYVWKYKNKINHEIKLEKDEVFKNIGTFDGMDFSNYDISNYGKIKSKSSDKYLKHAGKYYLKIGLKPKNKKSKTLYVHRLIAFVFVKGRTKQNNVVNHKDHNIKNNYFKNLEWTDYIGNGIHALGKKINQIDIKTNKILNTFDSIGDATRKLHLLLTSKTNISACCRGKRTTSCGFKWQFVK